MARRTIRPPRARTAVGIVATAASVVALSLAGATGAQASDLTTFSGAVPSWATHANDTGATTPDTSVEGELYLPLRNQAGAEALATAVSTPGNRLYRKSLSPAQWIASYSPTQASVNTVVNYLTTKGLSITAVPKSRQYVVFRGSADAVNSVFAANLHTYSFEGTKLVGPSTAPTLPSAIGSQVQGVSLDQAKLLTHPDLVAQGSGTATVNPRNRSVVPTTPATPAATKAVCSTYTGEHTATVPAAYGSTTVDTFNCGYTPKQLRSAYGLDAYNRIGLNGRGQTVAIIDAYASPSIVQDANAYSAANGEPQLTGATYQQIVPTPAQFTDQAACQYPSGWQGEQTLDVESAHALAPGAKILYVGGTNCGGGLDVAMSKILDDKLATIVSNSYGNTGEAIPLDSIQGQVNIELQAAGEGIGLYYSSGDNGDEVANLGYASPDFPASSPWVTAVGGTSLGIDKNGKKAYETGWGDTLDKIVTAADGTSSYAAPLPGNLYGGGAGGGVSGVFDQPSYQKGVVPTTLAAGKRVSPDLSALADPYTGFQIGISPIADDTTLATDPYENETYGGTSLASPLTAAMIAVTQQSTYSTIGFANPTLYSLYKVAPFLFADVVPPATPKALAYTSATSGNSYLVTLNTDTSLTTAKGYDDVTGLGSISFGLLSSIGRGHQ
ncbi:S53 family peptidase [Frondihabitans cladoniiphilus]|uniref:S53 family peptidase n=1 Tax=Frondihabitans cladoniiphilus TaxID=715785 RepID=A0ABP8W5Q8_9MICO